MEPKFSHQLKAVRLSLGLTQQQFAEKIGLSVNSVRRYESGEREPSMRQISAIVDKLGMTLSEFLWGPLSEGKREPYVSDIDIRDVYRIEAPQPEDIDPDLSLEQREACRKLTQRLFETVGQLRYEDKKAVLKFAEYLLDCDPLPATDPSPSNPQGGASEK